MLTGMRDLLHGAHPVRYHHNERNPLEVARPLPAERSDANIVWRPGRKAHTPWNARTPDGDHRELNLVLHMSDPGHLPVLLEKVMGALNLQPDGVYVDVTYGRGGHCAEILHRLGANGRLLALDCDPQAVAAGQDRFAGDKRFSVTKARFSTMRRHLESEGLMGRVNGILFDLGVSSPQLDDPARGFSFQHDGPLDMRMDPEAGLSAAGWLNTASEREIVSVLSNLGEERYAKRIARAAVRDRARRRIETSEQLARLVASVVPGREPGQHPATRAFLAIRIFVNRELEELQAALPQTLQALAPSGRLAVISFHSLEHRMVKRFMREHARGDTLPPDLPVRGHALEPRLRLVGKPIRPSEAEIQRNPRARSAVLRVAERTGVGCD